MSQSTSWFKAAGKLVSAAVSATTTSTSPTLSNKDPTDLTAIHSLSDTIASLKKACELKDEMFSINVLNITNNIIEEIEQIEQSITSTSSTVSTTSQTHGDEPQLSSTSTLSIAVNTLGAGGVCHFIDQLLAMELNSSKNCFCCLKLLYLLLYSTENYKKVTMQTDLCLKIVKVLQLHARKADVVEVSLKCVLRLSRDDDAIARLVTYGACEVTAQVVSFNTTHFMILELACHVIYNFTHDREDSGKRFSTAGTCESIVVTVLQENYQSNLPQSLAKWSLRAIGGLARRNQENKETLANLGACDIIMKLLKTYHTPIMTVVGTNDDINSNSNNEMELLFESVCWSIGNIAYPSQDNQDRLGRLNACEDIVNYLNMYISNSSIAREAFRAIRSLCHENDNNLEILATAGACVTIVNAITRHFSDRDTVQWGWYVVASLAQRSANIELLNEAGVCSILVDSIIQYGNIGDTMQWSCMALAELAISESVISRIRQLDSKTLTLAIVQSLNIHIDDSDVVEEVLAAVAALAIDVDCSLLLSDAGISHLVAKIISKHERCESVVEQGLLVSMRLIEKKDSTCESIALTIIANDGCNIICKVASRYIDNKNILKYACSVLSMFATLDKARDKLITAGSISILTQAIQMHLGDTKILLPCIKGLDRISQCDAAVTKFKASNVYQVIGLVLKAVCSETFYTDTDSQTNLMVACLISIKNMCRFDGIRAKISSDDCCESIVKIGRMKHLNDVQVYSNVCLTLACLAGGDNYATTATYINTYSVHMELVDYESICVTCEYFGQLQAVEMLVDILAAHSADEVCVSAVCIAINTLAALGLNRCRFEGTNIFELLLQAIKTHTSNQSLLYFAVNAVGTLALRNTTNITTSPSAGHYHDNQNKLGDAGACELLCDVLSKYADNVPIIEAVTRAVAHLASKNQVNRNRFYSSGIIPMITKALSVDISSSQRASLHICAAIESVSHEQIEEYFEQFSDRMITAAIIRIMRMHSSSESIVEVCCRAIVSLKTLNLQFAECRTSEVVITALMQYLNSENISYWVCRCISSLASLTQNKSELCRLGACEAINATLSRHINDSVISVMLMRNTSSAGVAQWGCEAIFKLCMTSESYSSAQCTTPIKTQNGAHSRIIEEYQKRFINVGACESVTKALIKYSEVEDVAQACCRAVLVLCYGNEISRIRLGQLGVCTHIVDSLHRFPASIYIATWGCSAVAALSDGGDEPNINRFASAGACETLPIVLQAHQSNVAVSEAGCAAIANMTSRSISSHSNAVNNSILTRFGHSNACEAVGTSLHNHISHEGVVKSACSAIANLAQAPGNAGWFGASGVVDALLLALKRHQQNPQVYAAASEAFGNLCNDQKNKSLLGLGGACELTVDGMVRHQDEVDVAIWAAYAIGKLCDVGTSSGATATNSNSLQSNSPSISVDDSSVSCDTKTNRSQLIHAGVCKVVVESLLKHYHNVVASFHLCRTISILAYGDSCSWERQTLGSSACEAVVLALQRHIDVEGVCRNAALALRSLASNNDENQNSISSVGGCVALVEALKKHQQPENGAIGVVEAVVWAIHNLSFKNSSVRCTFGRTDICNILVSTLELHNSKLDVAHWICFAMYELCHDDTGNRSSFSFSPTAAAQLCNLLVKYQDNDTICQIASFTMLDMTLDKVGQHKLGKAGVCKQVVQLLQRADTISDAYTQLCCELMIGLSDRSLENQRLLSQAGGCTLLISILSNHIQNALCSSNYFAIASEEESVFNGHSINKIIDKKPKRRSILAVSADSIVNTAGNIVVGGSMVASHHNRFETDSACTPVSRYLAAVSLCKAVLALIINNNANKKKIIATGAHEAMYNYINSTTGENINENHSNKSIRYYLTELLQSIQSKSTPVQDEVDDIVDDVYSQIDV